MMDYNPQAKVIVILKSSADANVSIEKGNFYFSTLKSIAVYISKLHIGNNDSDDEGHTIHSCKIFGCFYQAR